MITILQKAPDLLPRTRYSIWDERMPSFCLKAAARPGEAPEAEATKTPEQVEDEKRLQECGGQLQLRGR